MSEAEHRECGRLVLEFFGGDVAKCSLWFASPNPLLGGIAPDDMLVMGREVKLLRIIKGQLEDNWMPPQQNPADADVVLVTYEREQ